MNPTERGVRVVLRDGSEVIIDQVHRTDAPLLTEGFARLSEETRRLRFLTAKPRLTEAEVRYFTQVDHHDHEALGAMVPVGGRGVGLARYIRDRSDPETAEVAVTVADDWQGRGLGTELLRRINAGLDGRIRGGRQKSLWQRDLLAHTIEYNPTRTESSLRRGILHIALQRDDVVGAQHLGGGVGAVVGVRRLLVLVLFLLDDDQPLVALQPPGDAPLVASLGTASGYVAVLVLALYINSETVAVLYARRRRQHGTRCPQRPFQAHAARARQHAHLRGRARARAGSATCCRGSLRPKCRHGAGFSPPCRRRAWCG